MKETTGHESRVTSHESRVPGHDEIIFVDYWRVIKKYRKTIAGILIVASITAVIYSLLLPNTFRAEALIIPISSRGGAGGGLSALSSQFGSLASLAGLSLPGGAGDKEKIIAILKSRTLAENVIKSENLMPVFFEKKWDAKKGRWKSDNPKKQPNMEKAVRKMKKAVKIIDDKKNKTIKISGVFGSPELAARIVNVYLSELQNFINDNAFTMAKRNRIFIEGQLEENKQNLLEAGKEINEFYQGNRISSAEARVDVPLNRDTLHVTRDTENQSGARLSDSDLTGYVSPVTGYDSGGKLNPIIGTAEAGTVDTGNVSRVTGNDKSELTGLISQKEDIEKKIAEVRSVKNVPHQVYLSYLMLRRELLGKVNALLTSQYEMAKIEESKEELSFQVIDKAVPPVQRFKPKRSQICVMSFMAALFGAIFLAFFREYLARMKELHRMEQMDGRR